MTMNFERNWMELELTLRFAPFFHSRWGSWLFPHSTRIIQKSSARKLFFQLVLLFITSSSPIPYFSSLKSCLVVPKQANMKLTNLCCAYFSNIICCLLCTERNRELEITFAYQDRVFISTCIHAYRTCDSCMEISCFATPLLPCIGDEEGLFLLRDCRRDIYQVI